MFILLSLLFEQIINLLREKMNITVDYVSSVVNCLIISFLLLEKNYSLMFRKPRDCQNGCMLNFGFLCNKMISFRTKNRTIQSGMNCMM